MDNPASIRDVAARAGVAVGTVSNVLNRPQLVAEATRTRVHQAIAETGFVRNESARQLKAGSSRTIGLIVLDVANPFFTDVARGVEDTANAADLAVILCNSDGDPAKELRYLDILDEQRVGGMLITPVNLRSDRLKRSRARGSAVVLLDYPSKAPDQCSAAVDDALGGELAVTHLISRGHNRIGFVGGPMGIRQVKERYEGAQRAVTAAGPKRGRQLMLFEQTALSGAEGRRAGAAIAEMPVAQRPTAVACANDLLALGVLSEVLNRGIRVPEDLAIVGYDDISYVGDSIIPLTSIRQPRQELGIAAARLLIDEIQNKEHQHEHILFKPELIVRASSGRPGTHQSIS